jgi:hypothetical protein
MTQTQQRYSVKVMGAFVNEVGEMSEMQLFGYLNNRLPIGYDPEEVLEELTRNGEATIPIGSPLGPKCANIVTIEGPR